MADDEAILRESVRSHSSYFSSLLTLIPAKFYVSKEALEVTDHFQGKEETKPSKQLRKKLAKNAKRLKLDPDHQKSIAELQQEIEDKEKDELAKIHSTNRHSNGLPADLAEHARPAAELKERLHEKIQQFQRKRKASESGGEEKKKKRRKESKAKKTQTKEITDKKNSVKVALQTENPDIKNVQKESSAVEFSKLKFSSGNETKFVKKKKKKDLKQLLHQAEKTKEKIESIKKTDKAKADEEKSKHTWKNVLRKAEGEKIRDDPKLIKKTLKRKEKQKEKSSSEWKERVQQQEQRKNDKQKLRTQHLKERKEMKGKKKKKTHSSKKTSKKPGKGR